MKRPPIFEHQAGPKKSFLVGGDAEDQHNSICRNVREQVIWAAIDDPWADPGTRPPIAVLFLQNEELVEAERQRYLDFYDIQGELASIDADGHFVDMTTRVRWEGWLGARLGFKRDEY